MSKFERKFGKYAVKNLSLILVICYVIGYVLTFAAPRVLPYLTLDAWSILHGQVWRLVTWVLIPPSTGLSIWILVMLCFYYSIGTTLERTWGTWRYNVYLFSGMLFTIAGAFLLIPLTAFILPGAGPEVLRAVSWSFSTYYVNMSIFLAFAATFPEARVLLMFFIPVKVKWLGILYAVLLVWEFVRSPYYLRVAIFASLLNFVIFWLRSRNMRRFSPSEVRRRSAYRRAVSGRTQGTTRGAASAGSAAAGQDSGRYGAKMAPPGRAGAAGTFHRCAICGRTELDGSDLEFRYCSRCEGSYEYCRDHLFTHVHVKNGQRIPDPAAAPADSGQSPDEGMPDERKPDGGTLN